MSLAGISKQRLPIPFRKDMHRHIRGNLGQQFTARRHQIEMRDEALAIQSAQNADHLPLAAAAGHFPNREQHSNLRSQAVALLGFALDGRRLGC
jgi:hypothetical protein